MENMKTQKTKVAVVIGIGILVAVLAGFLLRKKAIDLNDYLEIAVEGYEGYGTAEWNFDITKFENDYSGKLKFKDSGKNLLLNETESLEMVLSGELDRSSELKNGDKIVFSWDKSSIDELNQMYNYKFKADNETINVKGLEKVETFDAFENISIETSGYAPNGTARINIANTEDGIEKSLSYTLDKSSGLSNGDKVTVTISCIGNDVNSYCARTYGKVPETLEKTYEVNDLAAYVTSVEEIPDDMMEKMKKEVQDRIEADIASSLPEEVTMKSCEYQGVYFLKLKNSEDNLFMDQNMIEFVYKVTTDENFEERGARSEYTYYSCGRFSNLLKLKDNTVSVDLSGMTGSANIIIRTLEDITPHYSLFYSGYEDLDTLFQKRVTANLDYYEYTYQEAK